MSPDQTILARKNLDRRLAALPHDVSIGVQKGPPSSSSVTGMSGAPFALVAA